MNHYQQYVGQILDKKYRIDAVLGVGGMSAVLAARDLESGQRVAVKMLKEEISDDKQAVRQFIT
jgi:serine/threonine-protein kinase